jgi:hypothetical protein
MLIHGVEGKVSGTGESVSAEAQLGTKQTLPVKA